MTPTRSSLPQAVASICTALNRVGETFTIRLEHVALTLGGDDPATLTFIRDYFDGFDGPEGMRASPVAASVVVSTDGRRMTAIEDHLSPELPEDDRQALRWFSATEGVDILLQRAGDPQRTRLIVVVLRQQHKVLVLLPGADEFSRMEAVRAARDLVEALLLRGGMAALHAGALVYAGRAVCCVGPKYAGKSTTVINAIARGLGAFMANDKVLVFEEDGHFWARGLPVAAGLRVGTLRLFDSLAPVLDQRLLLHCENWKVDAGRLGDSSTRVYVRPQALVRFLGSGIVARAPIGAVIYPRYRPELRETRLRALSPLEALQQMYEALPATQFEDQPYWTSWIAAEDLPGRRLEVIERMLRRVPAYELLQNERSNAEAADILDTVLNLGASRRGRKDGAMKRKRVSRRGPKDGAVKRKRAPFQVLVLPFRLENFGRPLYAVLRREAKTGGYWQFVAGGGEEGESPLEAAKREGEEEASIDPGREYIRLDSMTTIPVVNVCGFRWGEQTLVIPEYSFGADLTGQDIRLSKEHTEYQWVSYDTAQQMLQWDSNKSALWELDHRLRNGPDRDG